MSPRCLTPAVVLAVLLAACGSDPGSASPTAATPTTADILSPSPTTPSAPSARVGESREPAASSPTDSSTSAAGLCEAPQQLPIQGGEHLIGDNPPPVPYNSVPPTSGWHASGALEVQVRPVDDPLSEPRQVSVLEAGGVVVTYQGLAEADRAALEQHVSERYGGRVAVTSYEPLDAGAVAFTAWGVLQRCDGVDLAALDAFVQAHADDEVRTGHSH